MPPSPPPAVATPSGSCHHRRRWAPPGARAVDRLSRASAWVESRRTRRRASCRPRLPPSTVAHAAAARGIRLGRRSTEPGWTGRLKAGARRGGARAGQGRGGRGRGKWDVSKNVAKRTALQSYARGSPVLSGATVGAAPGPCLGALRRARGVAPT